ncbi:hypothetical protein MCC01959_07900 [Bifidobacteriaceae bacterium MCC01959]|nr:hypothetical protein MCC01957_12960 [Bifidobacteriaceae bacterium MCC01957]GDZ26139.1 hypothetical protein MCC01959_07900 [Bifidobacteriaceae bacterium MCC01959]
MPAGTSANASLPRFITPPASFKRCHKLKRPFMPPSMREWRATGLAACRQLPPTAANYRQLPPSTANSN